ncbi:MAG: transposase [Caldilineaceae bacterium]
MSVALIVGIDMAKKSFTAAYRVGEAGRDLGDFANEMAGYEALQSRLSHTCEEQGMTQIHLILEATGGYEAALLVYAYAQGWWVSMPNPAQVRNWAKGVPAIAAKTDRIDARILAHYGVDRRPPLRPQLASEVTEMDSLLKRRLDLAKHAKKRNALFRVGESTWHFAQSARKSPAGD